MELIHKIRAFFQVKGEIKEVKLSSVEIKKDRVFLHPADDPDHILRINTNSVDIFIDPQEDVLEENIELVDTPKNKSDSNSKKSPATPSIDKTGDHGRHQLHNMSYYMPKKKRISFLVYPEEYNMIMDRIQSHGYKKTEYFFACTKAARQTSVESAYKYYTKFHKQKKFEDLQRAREAQQSAIREQAQEEQEG